MRRFFLLFRSWGWWKYLPLVALVAAPLWYYYLVNIAQEQFPEVYLYLFTANVMPLFACVWPILSLRDAVHNQGGELYFHWKRSPLFWVWQNTVLIGIFMVGAFIIPLILLLPYGSLGLGFVVRYVLFCFFYGWLGFTVMWFAKEHVWALFACLLFLLVCSFGRMIQQVFWNPYRSYLIEYFSQISIHHTVCTLAWIIACILLFTIGYARKKGA